MPPFSIFILSIVTPLFSFWIFFSSALQPAASVFLAYWGFVFCGEPSEVLIIKSSPHCWQHLPPIWRAFWTCCAVMKIVFLHKANDFLYINNTFSHFSVCACTDKLTAFDITPHLHALYSTNWQHVAENAFTDRKHQLSLSRKGVSSTKWLKARNSSNLFDSFVNLTTAGGRRAYIFAFWLHFTKRSRLTAVK